MNFCQLLEIDAGYYVLYFGGSLVLGLTGVCLISLRNYFHNNNVMGNKIKMLNCLLDRVKLDSKIRLVETMIIKSKERIYILSKELVTIKNRIHDVKDEYDKVEDREERNEILATLYEKEERCAQEGSDLEDLCYNKEIDLEEMRERYDTLSEISTMESCGRNLENVIEEKISTYRAIIKDLNYQILCKDNLIARLENKNN